MTKIGTLILPYVDVKWGSIKLTPYKGKESVIISCSVSLE